MCSLPKKDERQAFALKSGNNCHSDSNGISRAGGQATAHLVCKERSVDYWMRNSRITVGRSSSKRGSADIDMGQSTFISRNHLEIYTTEAKFYALVTGKNGIFISDKFYKKGGTAFELPEKCIIRFPSTDIKISFEMHLPSPQPEKLPQTPLNSVLKTNSYNDLSSPSNCITMADGSICQISEEVVTQTHSQTHPDSTQAGGDSTPRESNNTTDTPDHYNDNNNDDIHSNNLLNSFSSNHSNITNGISNNNHNNHNHNNSKRAKPPYSYAQLIVQAISSQKDHQLTLSGIYNYITNLYPFYRHGDKGWQNSIRHNLSLNRYFVKVPRSQEEAGKGCFWKIDSTSEALLIGQAFRKRRQRPAPYCRNNSFDAVTSGSLDNTTGGMVGGSVVGGGVDDPGWEIVSPQTTSNDDASFSYLCTTDDFKAFANSMSFNGSGTPYNNSMALLNGKSPLMLNKTSSSSSSSSPNHHHHQHPPAFLHQLLYPSIGDRLKLEILPSPQQQPPAPSAPSTTTQASPPTSADGVSLPKKAILFSTQPKTIILRSTINSNSNNNHLLSNVGNQKHNLNLPTGSQLIKLSYAPQKTSTPMQSLPIHHPSTPDLPSSKHVNGVEESSLMC